MYGVYEIQLSKNIYARSTFGTETAVREDRRRGSTTGTTRHKGSTVASTGLRVSLAPCTRRTVRKIRVITR